MDEFTSGGKRKVNVLSTDEIIDALRQEISSLRGEVQILKEKDEKKEIQAGTLEENIPVKKKTVTQREEIVSNSVTEGTHVEEVDVLETSIKKQRSILENLGKSSIIDRFFDSDDMNQENDGERVSATIHLYTVFAISKRRIHFASFMIFLSLSYLALQIVIFQGAVLDLAFPSCTMHSDCPLGQFCSETKSWFPNSNHCYDCSYHLEQHTPINNDRTVIMNIQNETVDCAQIVGPGVDLGAEKEILVVDTLTQIKSECVAKLYCAITDKLDNACDAYVLNKERLSLDFIVSLFFLSFVGLAPILTKEVEEALYEERTLTKTITIMKSSNARFLIVRKIAAQIMYIALRVRCYLMPFLTVIATASVIIGDPFSVKNLLLNILSIVFLVEIDNLSMTFLVPPGELSKFESFVKHVNSSNRLKEDQLKLENILSWIWSRIISVTAIAVMILAILKFDELFNSTQSCQGAFRQMLLLLLVTSGSFALIHSLGVLIVKNSLAKFVFDLWRNAFAICFMQLIIYLLSRSNGIDMNPLVSVLVFLITGGCTVFLGLFNLCNKLMLAGYHCLKPKPKEKSSKHLISQP